MMLLMMVVLISTEIKIFWMNVILYGTFMMLMMMMVLTSTDIKIGLCDLKKGRRLLGLF